jgi:hypothetical protein
MRLSSECLSCDSVLQDINIFSTKLAYAAMVENITLVICHSKHT